MTLMAQLSVRGGRAAVVFYQAAFGAVEDHRVGGTDDHEDLVAQLSNGDSAFWVSDEALEYGHSSPASLGGRSARMLLFADDPAGAVARAVAAGATEVAPVYEAHGWVIGQVEDPFGHRWEIGRPPADWPGA